MTTARKASTGSGVVRTASGFWFVVAMVSTALSAAVAGIPGLLGALIGSAVVLAFFGLGQLTLTLLRGIEPTVFLTVAMLTYVVQLLGLIVVFGIVGAWSDEISTRALGLTIIAGTIAWTTGLVVASRRQRIPLFDLGREAK